MNAGIFVIFDGLMKKTFPLLMLLPLIAQACTVKEKKEDPILGSWRCIQSEMRIENSPTSVIKNETDLLRWEFLHSVIYNTYEFIDHNNSDTEMFGYTHQNDTLRIKRYQVEEVYLIEKLDSSDLIVVSISPQNGMKYYFKKVKTFYEH
jgi:hypothetical protein